MNLPWWLKAALGVVSVFQPSLKWLYPVVQAAYEIWLNIPWFHKAGALVELRKVVKEAKKSETTEPVDEFNSRWKTHCEGVGCPTDLKSS